MQKIFFILAFTILLFSFTINTKQKGEVKTDTVYIEKENPQHTPPPVKEKVEPDDKEKEDPSEPPGSDEFGDISGIHNLTLQWISWDKPGKAVIKRIGRDTYSITGSQHGNGQTLKIDGTLKMITPLELEFEGKIETGYYGEATSSCVKEGKQIFLSTKGRKYWRLQNMASCENDGLTDYVDIYF